MWFCCISESLSGKNPSHSSCWHFQVFLNSAQIRATLCIELIILIFKTCKWFVFVNSLSIIFLDYRKMDSSLQNEKNLPTWKFFSYSQSSFSFPIDRPAVSYFHIACNITPHDEGLHFHSLAFATSEHRVSEEGAYNHKAFSG